MSIKDGKETPYQVHLYGFPDRAETIRALGPEAAAKVFVSNNFSTFQDPIHCVVKYGRGLVAEPVVTWDEVKSYRSGLLAEIRRRLGLTQEELGLLLGKPANTIARWERGQLAIESPKMLRLALNEIERKTMRDKFEAFARSKGHRLEQGLASFIHNEEAAREFAAEAEKEGFKNIHVSYVHAGSYSGMDDLTKLPKYWYVSLMDWV
jgi:transcriptional regulator with XRE-family HTH domain